MLNEEPVIDQITYNDQGVIGTRKWSLDQGDDLDGAVLMICESHWPGSPDMLPINVQVGAFWEGTVIHGSGQQTKLTIGPLPTYGKYGIVAHYQLHNLVNCWPEKYPKPWHPKGTTLSLRIRSSGQSLLVSPAGFRPGTEGVCNPESPIMAMNPASQSTILISITEYHLTCDRMTLDQVNKAFDSEHGYGMDWDLRENTVNEAPFMGAVPGTMLFDNYELDEIYVPHPITPHRYRLTALLRQRNIVDPYGHPLVACDGQYVGWNHDYVVESKKGGAWRFINLIHNYQNCTGSFNDQASQATVGCSPRYPSAPFCNLSQSACTVPVRPGGNGAAPFSARGAG